MSYQLDRRYRAVSLFLRIFRIVLISSGLGLLLLNSLRFFIPLRNPEIYSERNTCFSDDIVLNEEQLWTELNKTNRPREEYLRAINDAINRGIACYWHKDGIEKYNIRIPPQENYLLFTLSHIRPWNYREYQFCNYKKSIQRGLGWCNDHAAILTEWLKTQGIEANMIELDGHVVSGAMVDQKEWWVLDPDYGVVIPTSLQNIEQDPSIVYRYYREKGYADSIARHQQKIYGKEGNRVRRGVEEYFPKKKCDIERSSYLLIWLIPFELIILGLFLPVTREVLPDYDR